MRAVPSSHRLQHHDHRLQRCCRRQRRRYPQCRRRPQLRSLSPILRSFTLALYKQKIVSLFDGTMRFEGG
ncbi:uncharacterized protein G2W53_033223 [Senna tora]|uniref:Uncharacterized protein n=1 Tax=Senna tora TaxID=362788 RepID=A0A834SZQ6_9FABA|nr:uncharacterized protein G2W53_033223 [Senna tora]